MVRGERRRSPGAPAVLRWIAADARDVARIGRAWPARPAVAVETIARGVRRWQYRVERRRLLALMRRAGLVGLGDQIIQVDPGTRTVVVRLGAADPIPVPPAFGPAQASRVVTEAVIRK